MRQRARVCLHIRPGTDGTPPARGRRTAATIAGELRALVERERIRSPVILVARPSAGS